MVYFQFNRVLTHLANLDSFGMFKAQSQLLPGWSQSWWKVNTGVCLADTEVALRHPGVLGFGM